MPKPGFFDFDELMTASGRCATSPTPRGCSGREMGPRTFQRVIECRSCAAG
jgi:hypothetical protein